jgi:quercetin dioxygenase-like cupin family protein
MADKDSSRSATMVPSEVVAVSELVKVAPDAIVSRALMRSPGGNVTVFAFAAGQELAEHTAPFDALVQVVSGRLELTIGGRPVTVTGGELVVMPARVPHALRAAADSTMILTMLRDRGEG